jgi:general secretion pathway protein N
MIVYGELTEDRSTPVGSVASRVADASRAAVAQADAPFVLPPIESYAEVMARPLFSASRRPAPQQVAQRGSLEPASLALTGIILSSQSRTALVQEAKSPKPIRLAEGQEVQGWTVQSILPDRIVIRRGTLEQEVKLHAASQGAQAGAPASTARTQ